MSGSCADTFHVSCPLEGLSEHSRNQQQPARNRFQTLNLISPEGNTVSDGHCQRAHGHDLKKKTSPGHCGSFGWSIGLDSEGSRVLSLVGARAGGSQCFSLTFMLPSLSLSPFRPLSLDQGTYPREDLKEQHFIPCLSIHSILSKPNSESPASPHWNERPMWSNVSVFLHKD